MTNKAKLNERLKLWKTPPPRPLPRSTLKTSWQLPSSPRPRDIKSGGGWVEEERKLWEVEVRGSFNVLLVSRTTASWTLLSGPSTHLIWTDHFFKWFVLWSFLLAHFNFQLPLCRLSLICWRGLLDTDRTVAIK